MKNNIENVLDNFIDAPLDEAEVKKTKNSKKVILDEREGLIERVDKVYVTSDGRQLLRERY